MSGVDNLLRWIQNRVNSYPNVHVTNFTKDWADGLAFCALLHSYVPAKIPFMSLDAKNKEKNIGLAFKVADELGIPSLLDVEDMLIPTPDRLSVITYVSQYYHHFKAQGPSSSPTPAAKVSFDDALKGWAEEQIRNQRAKNEADRRAAACKLKAEAVPEKQIDESKAAKCTACKKALSGRAVQVACGSYHPDCFACAGCKKALTAQCLVVHSQPWCEPCGKRAFVSKAPAGSTAPRSSGPRLSAAEAAAKKKESAQAADQDRLAQRKARLEAQEKASQEAARQRMAGPGTAPAAKAAAPVPKPAPATTPAARQTAPAAAPPAAAPAARQAAPATSAAAPRRDAEPAKKMTWAEMREKEKQDRVEATKRQYEEARQRSLAAEKARQDAREEAKKNEAPAAMPADTSDRDNLRAWMEQKKEEERRRKERDMERILGRRARAEGASATPQEARGSYSGSSEVSRAPSHQTRRSYEPSSPVSSPATPTPAPTAASPRVEENTLSEDFNKSASVDEFVSESPRADAVDVQPPVEETREEEVVQEELEAEDVVLEEPEILDITPISIVQIEPAVDSPRTPDVPDFSGEDADKEAKHRLRMKVFERLRKVSPVLDPKEEEKAVQRRARERELKREERARRRAEEEARVQAELEAARAKRRDLQEENARKEREAAEQRARDEEQRAREREERRRAHTAELEAEEAERARKMEELRRQMEEKKRRLLEPGGSPSTTRSCDSSAGSSPAVGRSPGGRQSARQRYGLE